MTACHGDWRLKASRLAALHRWILAHSFETADGYQVWIGKLKEACPPVMSKAHENYRRMLIRKLEQQGKIHASYKRPLWVIVILENPPDDRSDIPPAPAQANALKFASGKNDSETAYNRREALWFWLYGQADDHMLVEMASDLIPCEKETAQRDLKFLRSRGCLRTFRRGSRSVPHVWHLVRPPGENEKGKRGSWHTQNPQVEEQQRRHRLVLAWLSKKCDSGGVWHGKSKALPPVERNRHKTVRVMQKRGLLEILEMERYKHSIKVRVTEEGREFLRSRA